MTYVRYLSGPMRTIKDFNYLAFLEVEASLSDELSSTGYTDWEILNPARNFDGDNTRETNEYMQLDMEMVLASDELVLLPGWRNSEGARREVELAKWVGKKFTEAFQIDGVWYFRGIDVPTLDDSPRASALAEATQLITGDRNSQYGPPTADFKRTAAMATGFGFGVTVDGQTYKPLASHHVAIFMMLLKTSRLAWTPTKRDSWVDDAGYAGCGYECAVEEAANGNS